MRTDTVLNTLNYYEMSFSLRKNNCLMEQKKLNNNIRGILLFTETITANYKIRTYKTKYHRDQIDIFTEKKK